MNILKKATSIFIILMLVGCKNSNFNSDNSSYDYDDVKNLIIEPKDIFLMQNSCYFVYFYQLNCLHCIMLKQDIIDYALYGSIDTYFIQYSDEIPIIEDASSTIGCDSIDVFGILGTPSLVLIKENKVILNIAGEDLIKTVLNEYK